MKRSYSIGILLALTLIASKVRAETSPCAGLFAAENEAQVSAEITPEWLAQASQKVQSSSPETMQLQNAAQSLGPRKVTVNLEVLRQKPLFYDHELPRISVTDQAQSGRCWIFAGCNVLRSSLVAAGKGAEDFEFSEAYFHFFNILEKANKKLMIVSERADPGMTLQEISKELSVGGSLGDGGWFTWFNFLVQKYGAVPKYAMPETASSKNTGEMNQQIELQMAVIVEDMLQALQSPQGRSAPRETLLRIKAQGMTEIYGILSAHLGDPQLAQKFKFVLPGKEDSKPEIREFTPKEFARSYLRYDPKDYVAITSYPQLKAGEHYFYQGSSIAVTGPNSPYLPESILNLGTERMKELVRASIDDPAKSAVWFAADVMKSTDTVSGIMHPEIFNTSAFLGLPEQRTPTRILSRLTEMALGVSAPDHAMAFTGYTGDGNWFKVDNSWGTIAGDGGEFHMHSSWFDRYVYEIIVPRRLLNESERSKLETRPQMIQWNTVDP